MPNPDVKGKCFKCGVDCYKEHYCFGCREYICEPHSVNGSLMGGHDPEGPPGGGRGLMCCRQKPRWESPLPGRCPENPPPNPGGHHNWRCSNTEDADVCSLCGAFRSLCQHARGRRRREEQKTNV